MSPRHVAALLAAFAAIVLSAAGCSEGTPANGVINVTGDANGTFQIYTMNPDGSGITQLTSVEDTPAHGAWSPDGTMLAFTRATSKSSAIWTMAADGTDMRLLTPPTSSNLVPSWSPDGARIALESDRDGNFDVYTMAADGSDVRQVTFTAAPTQNYGPKYSPDGKTLLYASNAEKPSDPHANDLWLIDVDGANPRQLTFGFDNAESRSWAPDGSQIVFSAVTAGIAQLFIVSPGGGDPRQITDVPGSTPFSPGGIFPTMNGAITPVWSPDGRLIAFASNVGIGYEIFTVRPDGTELAQITNTGHHQLSLGWQPQPGR